MLSRGIYEPHCDYQNFVPFKNGNSPLETPLSKWKLQLWTFSDDEVLLLINRNPQNVRGIEIEPAGSVGYGR